MHGILSVYQPTVYSVVPIIEVGNQQWFPQKEGNENNEK
jgi:hypothetical protein